MIEVDQATVFLQCVGEDMPYFRAFRRLHAASQPASQADSDLVFLVQSVQPQKNLLVERGRGVFTSERNGEPRFPMSPASVT